MDPNNLIEDDEEQEEIYIHLFDENHIYALDEIGLGAYVRKINFDKLDRNQ